VSPELRLHDSYGHLWQVVPGTALLRRDDGIEMPSDRVLDVFGYGTSDARYLLGHVDHAALQPHTPDADYLRGAREAIAQVERRLAVYSGEMIRRSAADRALREAAAEIGVEVCR
jgi:thiamine pyrophosphate-dependent acetolactate synthase large subunit-like protein